jgi:hypothetical protein
MTTNESNQTSLTDLSSAALAVMAVRELGQAAASITDTQKRDDAFTSLHYLISLAEVSSNVRTRMRETAGRLSRG